ncbi:trna-dihydrouridine synthase 3-like [Moniliophthora roreri MCA 2997]|uniref:tRNA-dihydrouridine(47) synthase [NAD(P)(+)] n=2 Tax=Moniliophthora roreri TaxID=221103 RepID=V2XAA7_MONRO|nr:trna-dihydrouridine synthase 3-like [Moniliophthora roreri MCA 2997]KAI3597447.1 trna-dihydrouridine synthase 3-like [Moniliophthora roreri]
MSATQTQWPPGTAPIKAEYLVHHTLTTSSIADDDAAESNTSHSNSSHTNGRDSRDDRDKGNKSRKGANKNRRFQKIRDDLEICWKTANGSICEFGEECRYNHDVKGYLEGKPGDIRLRTVDEVLVLGEEVFKSGYGEGGEGGDGVRCPVFEERGECRYGYKCRFLSAHVTKSEAGELELVKDEEKKAQTAISMQEVNFVGPDTQKLLRTKKFPFPVWETYQKEVKALNEEEQKPKARVTQDADGDIILTEPAPAPVPRPSTIQSHEPTSPDGIDTSRTRYLEKNRFDWTGKTYLAPLTTVGNLPFRRLCVDYGADITCGEMGLAASFLSGSKEEWSLVRRHPSEKVFGVQVAGSKPNTLVPTAEVLYEECIKNGGIDFVDVNCGCPIDLVFKTGSGSALLDAPGKLIKILTGMSRALREIPVTVKLRTGVRDGKNTAHRTMPRLFSEVENGIGALTLHGRTRQQRYTKLADWDYIKECVDAVREKQRDDGLPPIPIFGNGDCFSYQSYRESLESTGVDGVMVGRGALIKPWIFTEIKECREWDISARERLDGIRKYAEYALSHFGTDTPGLNASRRYFCEALSFQHRYVPIGLLEVLPPRINDRAPGWRGRDWLETLLASPDSRDWVKISEMFLGPAPENWNFVPKHKSNAYDAEAQG